MQALSTKAPTFSQSTEPQLEKTVKINGIIQISLLAVTVLGALSFVIATAVTFNAYLLIGAGICTIVALAILGRTLCCRAMVNNKDTVFIPRSDSLYEQSYYLNHTPLSKISWPETGLLAGREIPGQRR